MKYLCLLITLVSQSTWAMYQKPQLLALTFSTRNENIAQDTYCYLGTPMIFEGKTVLNCQREDQHELVIWDEDQKVSTLFATKNFISVPQYLNGVLTWYEYDQEGVIKAHQWQQGAFSEIAVDIHARSVTFLGDKWIYQSRQGLKVLESGQFHTAQIENVSYVFSPSTSAQGDYAVKIRKGSHANSSPDEIWSFKNNKWIKVFSDRDSDPKSKWLSFNNNMAVGDGKIYVVAQDERGEVIVEISQTGQREIVRAGVDVKRFESFNIAYNKGSLVFRAIDHQNRKVIHVFNEKGLQRILTQGDIVHLPWGVSGEVNYHNEHSIIYNNPGIGENGEVIIQTALRDFNDKKTLLGIGIISIKRD